MAVVVGNPKPGSRTLGVARTVADVLAGQLRETAERVVVDLATVASDLFEPDSPNVNDLLAAVAGSDLIVVASPTFKATYTGLLKAFFDRYGSNALSRSVAVAVMTGAAPIHALATEVHLRPLLVELGASSPARGLYVTESQFADLDAVVRAWAEVAGPLLARALS